MAAKAAAEDMVTSRKKACDPFRYRPDIDGLRAVAVILVIIFHAERESLPGGFLGVDIFFTISGYVVTGSLLRAYGGASTSSSTKSSSISDYLAAFYARRLKRLQPSLLLTVAATAVGILLFIPPSFSPQYFGALSTGLIGGANIYLSSTDGGFRSGEENDMDSDQISEKIKKMAATVGGAEHSNMSGHVVAPRNPALHLWNLGALEQCYLVFPLILLLLYPGFKRSINYMCKQLFLTKNILVTVFKHFGHRLQFQPPSKWINYFSISPS